MSFQADGDQATDEDDYDYDISNTEDGKAYQACYRFVPRVRSSVDTPPAAKRRKTSHADPLFPPLLRGHENEQNAHRRYTCYRECWSHQEDRLSRLLHPASASLLRKVIDFVDLASTSLSNVKLQTGLIVSGPSTGPQSGLVEQWTSLPQKTDSTIVLQLDPAQNSNLITALKTVTKTAIMQLDGADGYKKFMNEHREKADMSFDLKLLQELVTMRDIDQCVLYLTDIESFDTSVLVELISMLFVWLDRIPFVLLIGISTTVELFESRLPKSTIRQLRCTRLDASAGPNLYGQLFDTVQDGAESSVPLFGPATSSILLDMSREQFVSPRQFLQAIKYANMSHFFSNALSVLPKGAPISRLSQRETCEAIRSTDSFQLHVEELLENGSVKAVRDLLDNDQALLRSAREAIANGQKAACQRHAAIHLCTTILDMGIPSHTPRDPFAAQVEPLSESAFVESDTFKDVVSVTRMLKSDDLRSLLDSLQDHELATRLDLAMHLAALDRICPINTKAAPLYSAHHPSRKSKTSTAVTKNNKISLSHHGPKLSPKETEYTRIIDDLIENLTSHLDQTLSSNPTTDFMCESYTYNSKIPLSTIFTPRPRHAIERALTTPTDYLDCDCCTGDDRGQKYTDILPTSPPTSILWRLWCQAGGIVNVWDLWKAFSGFVVIEDRDGEVEDGRQDEGDDEENKEGEGEEEEEEEEEKGEEGEEEEGKEANLPPRCIGRVSERMALALFYRGLADLRLLGFVKPTKRKRDCLAKVSWGGL